MKRSFGVYFYVIIMLVTHACVLQRQSYKYDDDSMGYQLAQTLAYDKPQSVKRDFPLVDFDGSRAKEMIIGIPSDWDKTEILEQKDGKIYLMALYHEDDIFLVGFQFEDAQKIIFPMKTLRYPHYIIDELYTKIDDPKRCYLKSFTLSKKEIFTSTYGENSYFIARLRPTYE